MFSGAAKDLFNKLLILKSFDELNDLCLEFNNLREYYNISIIETCKIFNSVDYFILNEKYEITRKSSIKESIQDETDTKE